jgi:hypothetical protein
VDVGINKTSIENLKSGHLIQQHQVFALEMQRLKLGKLETSEIPTKIAFETIEI